MEDAANTSKLYAFLTAVGQRLSSSEALSLLGGSGLHLLGSNRPTLDIDFAGEEISDSELRLVMEQVAADMDIQLEAVPLHLFVPLPSGSDERHIHVGTFGNLRVFVFDPYSIALSKLDRGFDSDIEDVVFLVRERFVKLETLGGIVADAAKSAAAYDLNPGQMRAHLDLVKQAVEGE